MSSGIKPRRYAPVASNHTLDLENEHVEPTPGQRQRSHQPVVASSDDDDVGGFWRASRNEAAGDGYPPFASN
jgi:hypothetical protein